MRSRLVGSSWRSAAGAAIRPGGWPICYTEFWPQDLAALCGLASFEEVEWSADATIYQGAGVLDFFQARLDRLLPRLPNDALREGFGQWSAGLWERARQTGGMEVPFYRLSARGSDGQQRPGHLRGA